MVPAVARCRKGRRGTGLERVRGRLQFIPAVTPCREGWSVSRCGSATGEDAGARGTELASPDRSRRLYPGAMKLSMWSLVAGLALLSACAPAATTAQGDLTTPILAPGQVWTLSTDTAEGLSTPPTEVTVGQPKRYGKSVGFERDVQTLPSGISTLDSFFYAPPDSDPAYIAAFQARLGADASLTTIKLCIVRNPVNQLDVQQSGLFSSDSAVEGALASPVTQAYIEKGTLTGQQTCKLTRVR